MKQDAQQSVGLGEGNARAGRCAFSGGRPAKLPFKGNEKDPRCLHFKRRLKAAIEELIVGGCAVFVSGGAPGTNIFAAEAVLKLKAPHPHIRLEMVIPYEKQAAAWPKKEQLRCRRLLDAADEVILLNRDYRPGCLQARKRFLADRADLLLAAYDGQPGGTAMTVQYAWRRGLAIRLLAP